MQKTPPGMQGAGIGPREPIRLEFIVGIDRMYQDQEGLHITGVLSVPRASLNGWIYLPEELEKQGGRTVPMFFEHEEMFKPNMEPIGVMNTLWNSALLQLEYDAVISDGEKAGEIIAGNFRHVSMAATWEDFDLVRGWLFPSGVEIVEGSLVSEPGIPETTVSIIDHSKTAANRKMLSVKDSIAQFIPTQLCTQSFCHSILKDSRKTDQAKNLSVCDKMSKQEDSKTETTNRDTGTDNGPRQKFAVIDANAMKLLLEQNSRTVMDAMREFVSPLQGALKSLRQQPTAVVGDPVLSKDRVRDVFYAIATDSFRKYQKLDWSYITEQLKANNIGLDALGLTELGASAGAQWLEDMTLVPAGLSVGLRGTCEVVLIERGAKEAHFTLISTPTPADGSAPTVPSDVTQTITDVLATPAERVLKQRVTDQAMRATRTNLASAVANTFRSAEILDEDDKILTEINGIATGNLAGDFFGGNATSESTIDSGDTFDHKLLAKAKRAILRKGWQEARIPGSIVCVMSPEQMEQLMSDSNIQRFIEWVNEGEVIRTGAIPRLHGIDLLVTTKVPTGSGAGMPAVTTHRAFVYVRQVAMGLAFTKDLQIESVRYPEERATTIVGSYEIASKNKRADAVARIVTYGSG